MFILSGSPAVKTGASGSACDKQQQQHNLLSFWFKMIRLDGLQELDIICMCFSPPIISLHSCRIYSQGPFPFGWTAGRTSYRWTREQSSLDWSPRNIDPESTIRVMTTLWTDPLGTVKRAVTWRNMAYVGLIDCSYLLDNSGCQRLHFTMSNFALSQTQQGNATGELSESSFDQLCYCPANHHFLVKQPLREVSPLWLEELHVSTL